MRRTMLVVVMAISSSGSVAQAAPPGHGSQALAAAQARVAAVQGRLDGVADGIERLKGRGFGGLEVNAIGRRITLYWHGPTPTNVRMAIRRSDAAGLRVALKASRYADATLIAAQNAIEDHVNGSDISVVEVSPSASGLQVGLTGSTAGADRALLEAHVEVPIQFFRSVIAPLSRWNDSPSSYSGRSRWKDAPPFYGGASIYNPTAEEGCSSGFPAHFSHDSTVFFMTTAGHCFQLPVKPQSWFAASGYDRYSWRLGEQWSATTTNDAASIRLGGDQGASKVYTGPADPDGGNGGQTLEKVLGDANSEDGDFVFTNGAYTGTVGNIKVIDDQAVWDFTDDGTNFHVAGNLAQQQKHKAAAGNGDSGGGVIEFRSGGIFARGIISYAQVSTQVPCQGVPTSRTRRCYWGFYYSNIIPALSNMGLSLNTS